MIDGCIESHVEDGGRLQINKVPASVHITLFVKRKLIAININIDDMLLRSWKRRAVRGNAAYGSGVIGRLRITMNDVVFVNATKIRPIFFRIYFPHRNFGLISRGY